MPDAKETTQLLELLRDEFCIGCGAYIAEAGGHPFVETDDDGKQLFGMAACGLREEYMQ